jgi:hypothetical protein
MVRLNDNFLKLPGGYLFPEISRRVKAFTAENPPRPLIRLGIGDVTQPLAPAVIGAMHASTDEMARKETFRGYSDDSAGYDFLRNAIAETDYKARGVDITADEIFISDGAKSDCGNIGDIFSANNVVAVFDPVYPVYIDTNVMAGRAGTLGSDGRWSDIIYLPCVESNGFFPDLPEKVPDIIYICSPNNPTGAAATKEQLKVWVDYANKTAPSSCSTRLTRHISRTIRSPTPSSRLTGRRRAPSSSAAFQNGGLHGHALRVHRHPGRARPGRRQGQHVVDAPPEHEIQRRCVRRPARRRGRLFPRQSRRERRSPIT